MVSIGDVRALAYRKGCSFDRTVISASGGYGPAGALSSAPLTFRDAYLVLMSMLDVQRA